MQSSRVLLILFAVAVTLSACDSSEPSGNDDGSDNPPGEIVLGDDVEVLEGGAENDVEVVSEDGRTITFQRGSNAAERLEVGDIIVAAPSDAAPDGLLKRVEDIDRGSQVVATVRSATIEEAVEEGTITAELTFSPDMIRGEPRMAPGARLVRAGKRGAAADVFTIELNDFVLYDDDTNLETTTDQIRASGVINFTAECSPRAIFRAFRLTGFRFTCTEEIDSELEVGWSRPFSWSGQTRVAPAPFVLTPLLIPGTPFWVTPKIDVYVGATVDGEVGVAATLTYDAMAEAGLEYENGRTEPIAELSHSVGYELDVTGRLAAEAYAGVPVSLLFMGVSGPYFEPQAYLALDADIDADPWWKLDWGLRADVGLETQILSGIVPDLRLEDVLDFRETLARAGGPFGNNLPPSPMLIAPADGAQNQSTSLTLDWASVAGASEYNAQVSTSSSFASTIVDRTVTVSSTTISGLNEERRYYWRVRARNDAGSGSWSSIRDFVTEGADGGGDPPPSPTLIAPADGAQNQSTSLTLDWASVAGASEYNAQVSASSTFAAPFVDRTVTASTTTLSGLDEEREYYWRVRARNDAGWGAWSSIWDFVVKGAVDEGCDGPLPPPTRLYPLNGSAQTAQQSPNTQFYFVNARFRFQSDLFQLQVERNADMSEPPPLLYLGVTYDIDYPLYFMQIDVPIYWRVRSVGGSDPFNPECYGPWSSVWSFIPTFP